MVGEGTPEASQPERMQSVRLAGQLGQALGAAETDINAIRSRSGSLPAVTLTSAAQALDQLLYEKRYSLLYEGGHRWLDLRRYGRLDELPEDA